MVSTNIGSGIDWFARDVASPSAVGGFRNDAAFNPVIVNNPNSPNYGKKVPGVTEITVTVADPSGGLGRVYGSAHQRTIYTGAGDLDRLQAASLISHDPGILCLPELTTLETSGRSKLAPLASTYCFGQLAFGHGSAANESLWVASVSTTSSPITLLTYSPGSTITYMVPIIIGGVTSALRIAVCKTGGAVELLSDLNNPPTSAGTMHVNTSPCWGIITSPLNSNSPGSGTLLIYANGNIYTLGCEQAIGTAPTVATSGVPNGGFPIGLVTLPGAPMRAYWAIPYQDMGTTSVLSNAADLTSANAVFRIASTNLEGTDFQYLDLPIPFVLHACKHGADAIACGDGYREYIIREKTIPVNPVNESPIDTANGYNVGNLTSFQGSLFAQMQKVNSGASTATISIWSLDDESKDAWSQISADVNAFGVSGSYTARSPGSLPIGQTQFIHYNAINTDSAGLGKWYYQHVETPGNRTFYLNNNGVFLFESTGSATSSALVFEEVPGQALVVEQCRSLGDIPQGGTDCSVQMEFAVETATGFSFTNSVTKTFYGRDWPRQQVLEFPDNTSWASRFVWKATATRSATTTKNMNIFPLQFKILAFENPDEVRSPADVRAGR